MPHGASFSSRALYRHRRRHVYCAGVGVPVLKMTAEAGSLLAAGHHPRRPGRRRASVDQHSIHRYGPCELPCDGSVAGLLELRCDGAAVPHRENDESCMSMRVRTCARARMRACVYVRTCWRHACGHACTCVDMCQDICADMQLRACALTRVCVHVCGHVHRHVGTQCVHACARMCMCLRMCASMQREGLACHAALRAAASESS